MSKLAKQQNINEIVSNIKKNAPEKSISDGGVRLNRNLLKAIFNELKKSYSLCGKQNFANDEDLKETTQGLAIECFADLDVKLIELIPDLFSIARKYQDIPSVKSIHKARNSSKWHYLVKTRADIKKAVERTEKRIEVLTNEQHQDFFKKLANKIKG